MRERVECIIVVFKRWFCNLATFTVFRILVLHITCRCALVLAYACVSLRCHYATYILVYPLTPQSIHNHYIQNSRKYGNTSFHDHQHSRSNNGHNCHRTFAKNMPSTPRIPQKSHSLILSSIKHYSQVYPPLIKYSQPSHFLVT